MMMIGQFYFMFYYLAGRVRIECFIPGDLDYTWDDYRGASELVRRARIYLKLLTGYEVYEQAGGKPIGGIMLEGAPGTGKTYLAKIMAAQAGCAFLSVDCSTLMGTFIGIAPLKVIGLFKKARKLAVAYGGCIMFLDEIDSIGRSRSGSQPQTMGMPWGGMFGGGVLTTLLVELDGLREAKGKMWRMKRKLYRLFGKEPSWTRPRVLPIGSTNIGQVLDAALTRPGRLGERIVIDLPDHEAAQDIAEYYLAQVQHDEDMNAAKLARDIPGKTPAFISEAIHQALRKAVEDDRDHATYLDWRHTIAELALGLRQPLPLHDKDKKRLAYHEAGHAVLVHELFRGEHRISLASIVRYGRALGHISHVPEEWVYTMTREDMVRAIYVSLGGIAAEECFLGTRVASAGGDIPNIQNILFFMVRHGMFGAPPPPSTGLTPIYGGDLQKRLDEFYDMSLKQTKLMLEQNSAQMHRLADALIKRGEILGEDVELLLETEACG
jgi:cell division protease FtsH